MGCVHAQCARARKSGSTHRAMRAHEIWRARSMHGIAGSSSSQRSARHATMLLHNRVYEFGIYRGCAACHIERDGPTLYSYTSKSLVLYIYRWYTRPRGGCLSAASYGGGGGIFCLQFSRVLKICLPSNPHFWTVHMFKQVMPRRESEGTCNHVCSIYCTISICNRAPVCANSRI